jgi:four helix bundle protein
VRHGGQLAHLLIPKSEIRMPKEIRNPKSDEQHFASDVLRQDSAFWNWGDESANDVLVFHDATPRDLMERTAEFGEAIVRFSKKIPHTPENTRLISQLVGAGTSIGANYCEADDSVSGKDFKKSIGTCRKESKETMFFLRMVAISEESLKAEARALWREAKELNLIFGAIWRK